MKNLADHGALQEIENYDFKIHPLANAKGGFSMQDKDGTIGKIFKEVVSKTAKQIAAGKFQEITRGQLPSIGHYHVSFLGVF